MKETSTKSVSSGMIPSSGGLSMSRWSSLVAVVAGALVTFAAGSARADILSDCGGAVFNGNESCTVDASASCDVQCSVSNLELACSADFESMCSGGCTATLPSCNTSCEASCMGSCQGGNFDCNANCTGTCEGDCSSSCSSSSDQATCEAECKGSCQGRCTASCSGSPPSCSGACQASCSGSCSGQANAMCDINCQAKLQGMCTAMLQAKCTGGCQAHTAIFCDGNFINATDANACVDDLKKLFNIEVSGWAYATSGCDGGTCSASAGAGGQASASCDMAPGDGPPLSAGLLGIGLGAAVVGVVRRRRK
jgi:hypothetical protein